MTMLADLLSTVFERRVRFSGPATDDTRSTEELAEALVGASGEISGRALGRQLLDRYDAMEDNDKRAFFRYLADEMNIKPEQVRSSLAAYETAATKSSYRAFMVAAEPKRQELIRRLNMLPGATGRLVNMRADLLRLLPDEPALSALDLDFRHLFASWFNRGFLVLRPISWKSPAHILEKIIAYEAVHAIDSWEDLRRRLEPSDRRCFAFFHPAMPDEPLIFVEVALTKDGASSVQTLLSDQRDVIEAEAADTAVFYSISNCQAGLASISFGNSLIKQVAADLAADLSGLKTFITLSPIPGLSTWMDAEHPDIDPADQSQIPLLAAHYLLAAKRSDGLPLDPVARFHLGNGALVHKVHAQADTSQKGIRQSAGAMVNYLYDLDKVSQNHEGFAASHIVAASAEIRSLSAQAEKILSQEAKQ